MSDVDESVHERLRPFDDGLLLRSCGEWSRQKLETLGRYISSSTTALSKKPFRRRIYIDLQAGPGKNCLKLPGREECPDADRDVFLGSPLLALSRGVSFTDVILVENAPGALEALRLRTEHSDHPSIKIYDNDLNVAVAEITEIVKRHDASHPPLSQTSWNCWCLAFIDPEGLEVRWATVEALMKLRVDFIINFPTGGLRRLARQAHDKPSTSLLFDQFFGTRDWRNYPVTHRVPIQDWARLYQQRFIDNGYRWGEPRSHKNSSNVEQYWLMFASRDTKNLALKLWNDASTQGHQQLGLPLG